MHRTGDINEGAPEGAVWCRLLGAMGVFTFETDAFGRFVFISPGAPFGGAAGDLLGVPAETLLLEPESLAWNPFRPNLLVRRGSVWLRGAEATRLLFTLACEPVTDADGRVTGVRGVAIGTPPETRPENTAAQRRADLLEQMLRSAQDEILAADMLRAALDAATQGLGARGGAIVEPWAQQPVSVHVGAPAAGVFDAAFQLLADGHAEPLVSFAENGTPVLVCATAGRFRPFGGAVLWRTPGAPAWNEEEREIFGAAAVILRMLLEQQSLQQEMIANARADLLTGLATRSSFMADLERRIERLDREESPGTLMLLDFDAPWPPNAGTPELRDQMLRNAATVLRATFRPSDLLARLGGGRFAAWLDGADELTAAERADSLVMRAPPALEIAAASLSIGIAPRWPRRDDTAETLLVRAERALHEAKYGGQGLWRVARG